MIFILAPTLGAICLAIVFVIALGIVAARADEHFDRQLAEEEGEARSRTREDIPIAVPVGGPVTRGSYAGLATPKPHAVRYVKP